MQYNEFRLEQSIELRKRIRSVNLTSDSQSIKFLSNTSEVDSGLSIIPNEVVEVEDLVQFVYFFHLGWSPEHIDSVLRQCEKFKNLKYLVIDMDFRTLRHEYNFQPAIEKVYKLKNVKLKFGKSSRQAYIYVLKSSKTNVLKVVALVTVLVSTLSLFCRMFMFT